MKSFYRFLAPLFIFLTAFLPRLYRLDNPVADWHSWRQSDTAAVARGFYQEGFDLFFPRAHNYYPMSEGSLPNPERYFLNEFPFYNALVGGLYYLNQGVDERLARLVSVCFSSGAAVMLFLLAKRHLNKGTAFLAGLLMAILPFNVYYGRVIMPDPAFIFFSLAGLYLASLWLKRDKLYLALAAALVLGLAMLVKPYAIFLGLPVGYLVFRQWGWTAFKRVEVYLVAGLALLPLIVWRQHITNYPEGMFGAGWLINQGNIRFTGAFFRWLVFERMNRLIFATGGFVLFWLGIVAPRSQDEGWFFYVWLLAIAAYMIYFARGNVTHDYYQLPLVPVGCVFMAKGFVFLVNLGRGWLRRLINVGVGLGLVVLMLAFGWYEVRGFFNINHPEVVKAGQAVDQLLPEDARVIAPYQRDPAFLYQTNRNGWSALDSRDQLKQFIDDGATHYVSVNFDQLTKELIDRCSVIKQTDDYVIVDLKECRW